MKKTLILLAVCFIVLILVNNSEEWRRRRRRSSRRRNTWKKIKNGATVVGVVSKIFGRKRGLDGRRNAILGQVTNCAKVQEVAAGKLSFLEYIVQEQENADVALVVQHGEVIIDDVGPYPPHYFKVLEVLKAVSSASIEVGDRVGFNIEHGRCWQMQALKDGTYIITLKVEKKEKDNAKWTGKIFHHSDDEKKFQNIRFDLTL